MTKPILLVAAVHERASTINNINFQMLKTTLTLAAVAAVTMADKKGKRGNKYDDDSK